jgi:hypothetical protein
VLLLEEAFAGFFAMPPELGFIVLLEFSLELPDAPDASPSAESELYGELDL